MKIVSSALLLLCALTINAQTAAAPQGAAPIPDPKPYAGSITSADLKDLVFTLAGKEMAGRETGQEGQRKAADYIAAQFKAIGLPPKGPKNSYFQPILLENESWKETKVAVGERELQLRTDYFFVQSATSDQAPLQIKDAVFVGYGIEDSARNDYGKTKVKGKTVIYYHNEPMNADGTSSITGAKHTSDWTNNWRKKVDLAREKGAEFVIIITPKFADAQKAIRSRSFGYGWKPKDAMAPAAVAAQPLNAIFVNEEIGALILGESKAEVDEWMKTRPSQKTIKVKTDVSVVLRKETKRLEGSNVIGFIEGSDPVLKNEYVLITAHYDHLGQVDERIYFGADDNASGTSGVIEIARAFAEAKQKGAGPKRSVVCMLVSGEEKGLLGSKYYVEYPVFPLEQTVVDINIDMIGRIDDAHANTPDYIYVIGSDRMSSELHQINEAANAAYTKMTLDYKYNALNDPNHFYERSDHYNFALRGIPAIFYFNGTHKDYHQAGDTPDKINLDAMAKRAQLAFYTAWEIANRPARLVVDKKDAGK